MSRSGVMVLLGALAWAISWFVSPHEALSVAKPVQDAFQDTFGKLADELHRASDDAAPAGDDERVRRVRAAEEALRNPPSSAGLGDAMPYSKGPPGWRAFRVSWDMLTGKNENKGDDSELKIRVLGLTGLTNFAMLAALLILAVSSVAVAPVRAMALLLLVACALDFSWIYLNDAKFVRGLEAGYYLWAGSFALVGLGLLQRGPVVVRVARPS